MPRLIRWLETGSLPDSLIAEVEGRREGLAGRLADGSIGCRLAADGVIAVVRGEPRGSALGVGASRAPVVVHVADDAPWFRVTQHHPSYVDFTGALAEFALSEPGWDGFVQSLRSPNPSARSLAEVLAIVEDHLYEPGYGRLLRSFGTPVVPGWLHLERRGHTFVQAVREQLDGPPSEPLLDLLKAGLGCWTPASSRWEGLELWQHGLARGMRELATVPTSIWRADPVRRLAETARLAASALCGLLTERALDYVVALGRLGTSTEVELQELCRRHPRGQR